MACAESSDALEEEMRNLEETYGKIQNLATGIMKESVFDRIYGKDNDSFSIKANTLEERASA